ncbi:hypothetical protein D3C87_1204520 [compost metagenome]
MTVVVVIAPGRTDRVPVVIDAGFSGDLGEGAVAIVAIQQVGPVNGDEDVEIAVVVIVADGAADAA